MVISEPAAGPERAGADPASFEPAGFDPAGFDPTGFDPNQLDPTQLDVAPPAVAPEAIVAVESPELAASTMTDQLTNQLTMELSPADHPHLEPARSCPLCGVVAAISDVFCESCGLQLTNDRDHYSEQPARWLAAVSDRGVRHPHNQDASATDADEASGSGVLVVCDGVSSAEESDLAALVAARAARDTLRGPDLALDVPGPDVLTDRLVAAVRDAHDAALRQTTPGSGASCTIVAAAVHADLVATVSVGDSRIYWLPDPGSDLGSDPAESSSGSGDWAVPRLLSVDDSVAELRVAAGVDRTEAEQAPDAHVITGWIGQHASSPDPQPLLVTPDRPGWLLLCTDGLWNYASEPDALAALVTALVADLRPGALALTDALVRWAVEQGGKDNVTAAACRVPFGADHPAAPETN